MRNEMQFRRFQGQSDSKIARLAEKRKRKQQQQKRAEQKLMMMKKIEGCGET
jgi:hypothetical protein